MFALEQLTRYLDIFLLVILSTIIVNIIPDTLVTKGEKNDCPGAVGDIFD